MEDSDEQHPKEVPTSRSPALQARGQLDQGAHNMVNKRRSDPYKNFNFRLLLGAVVGGVAAFGIFRKFFARVERRPPGVYIEETPTGTRPIEGVGTSTAGFVGVSPKQITRQSARARSRG
ncbi:MAG TPA: hypothetical protein VFU80_06930 [Sphingomicrobium sp.]|nr:hypothetical protein [Sphingomicrobium sp.]